MSLPAALAALCLLCSANPASAASPTPKIVGGQASSIEQFPATVALVGSRSASAYWGQFCGGTLVAPRWVLTAAHCVAGSSARAIDVVAGRSNLRTRSGHRVAAAAIYTNPRYSPRTVRYDAALIYLARAVPIDPGNLPHLSTSRPADGAPLETAGWGATEQDFPGQIRSAQVDLQADSLCSAAYDQGDFDPDSMLCAGKAGGGVDSCEGDSGGPLVSRPVAGESTDLTLVGLVSFGMSCGDPDHPGVYARVDAVEQWVAQQMSQPPRHIGLRPAGRERQVGPPKPEMLVGLWSWTDATPATRYFYGPEIKTNRRVDQLQVRFSSPTGTGDAQACTLDGAHCYREGEWFGMSSAPGRREWSVEVSSTTRCLRFSVRVGMAGTRMSGSIAEGGCKRHQLAANASALFSKGSAWSLPSSKSSPLRSEKPSSRIAATLGFRRGLLH